MSKRTEVEEGSGNVFGRYRFAEPGRTFRQSRLRHPRFRGNSRAAAYQTSCSANPENRSAEKSRVSCVASFRVFPPERPMHFLTLLGRDI